MGDTIVSFLDKDFKYGVDPDPNKRGLTIREFESAFLANLEASYILIKLRYILERHIRFSCTYRDDEIVAFNGQKLNNWLLNWLATFQQEVDRLLGTAEGNLAARQKNQHHYKTQKYWLKELAHFTVPASTETIHSPTSTPNFPGMTKEGFTLVSTKSWVLSISIMIATTTAATRQQSSPASNCA